MTPETTPDDAAVAAVRAGLAALPAPEVPAEYAARWAAALAAEAGPDGATRTRPAFARRLRPLLVAAALLGLLLAGGALWGQRPEPAAVDLASAARAAVGATDAGGLDDPVRRAGCLAAVRAPGVDPAAALLGGRRVELGGRPGVLLVLTGGARGAFHVVVVDPGCGPAGGALLGSTTTGGR